MKGKKVITYVKYIVSSAFLDLGVFNYYMSMPITAKIHVQYIPVVNMIVM